ncbi:hypothetical protein [Paraburkholderia tropica]|uniref:hypothetical protein n=1 Tax=Paraburkholderia tropica TaxID=92647 RepID=UPI003D282CFC
MKRTIALGAALAIAASNPSFGQNVTGKPQTSAESPKCAAANASAAKGTTPYELAQSNYTVAGSGRLQFLSAPAIGCEMKGVFVVPGDELMPTADYGDFTLVTYVNPKTGKQVDGWVDNRRLVKNGRRAYLGG